MPIKMTTDARIIEKFPQEVDIDKIRKSSTCYEIIRKNKRNGYVSFSCYDMCNSSTCGLDGCKPIPDAKRMIIKNKYEVKFS